MRKNIIRVGDEVKILVPTFFVRCGYEKSLHTEADVILNEHRAKIDEFINTILPRFKLYQERGGEERRLAYRIAKELAYDNLRLTGFGGKDRKIFTEEFPEYVGRTAHVMSIKFCKTGEYFAPSGGYSYYSGEYDYEPGGLSKEKTHKILELNLYHPTKMFEALRIEAIHVEPSLKREAAA